LKVSELRALAVSFLRNPRRKKGKIRLVYRAEGTEGLMALASLLSDISGCKVTVSELRKIGCLKGYQRKPRSGADRSTLTLISESDVTKSLEFNRSGTKNGKMGGKQNLQSSLFYQSV